MLTKINIYFDDILFKLLCLYAFFIPLEKILEVFFNIETQLKPYRVFAILIILVFAIRSFYKWDKNEELKTDIFLYIIFIYGGILTLYRMITSNFQMGYFLNDAFQIVLYLAVFVVIKHQKLSIAKVQTILKSLFLGVLANAAYIFYTSIILKMFSHRNSGFMDNPNYVSLSLVLLFLFIFTQRSQITSYLKKILLWGILPIMVYVFIMVGSRTGLAVLFLTGILIFFFSPMREKLIFIIAAVSIFFFVSFLKGLSFQSVGQLILLNRIEKNSQSDPRLPLWKGALRAAHETNFIGTGIGQFKANFRKFFYEENNAAVRGMVLKNYFLSPHSDYLALLAIYGLIGLLAYLTFLFLKIKELYFRTRLSLGSLEKNHFQLSIILVIAIALFGITAENFFSPLYWIVISTSTKIELY